MLPISVRAASRGSCVSVSRVMTYLIEARIEASPTISEKAVGSPSRSKALNCSSLPPVKQIEDARAILAVCLVERLDSCARVGNQRIVFWQRALGCVREICQQGKEQIRIAITEIADFQRLDKLIDLLRPAQQGGDNHHRAVSGWNSFRKIHSW